MFQYFPSLQAKGVELTTEALFDDEYLDCLYAKKNRFWSVIKAYAHRFRILLFAKGFEVLWIEKELFPWVPWFIEGWFLKRLRTPYVVDYDDAIFHQYDTHRSVLVRRLLGTKCDQVMRHSDIVVAGNEYLANRAKSAGAKKVTKIPTVVSENIFAPKDTENSVPVIGWIGSLSTAVYLEKLRPILSELSQKYEFKFRVVGANLNWPEVPVESISWSESQEVALVQSFDIGVMPLLDSPWERGKCGFKLIQYMACGKPVVADPVGVNSEIVEAGVNGYLVSPKMDWKNALTILLEDSEKRRSMGAAGNFKFRQSYSLETTQRLLKESLFSLRSKRFK
jgi:glycosyltransferase involved in cell wall biosynthesis